MHRPVAAPDGMDRTTMELIADQVSVAGTHSPLLLPTSLVAPPGRVTTVAGDPGYGHVALALALAGRVAHQGSVALDGVTDVGLRRRHVGLVDVPDVTAPEDAVNVRAVVAEQLALAGRPAGRAAVRDALACHGLQDAERARFESLDADRRTALLMDLAARREGLEVLVLSAPDRLGGDSRSWWRCAQEYAERGLVVVVQCTPATARDVGEPVHYELGVAA